MAAVLVLTGPVVGLASYHLTVPLERVDETTRSPFPRVVTNLENDGGALVTLPRRSGISKSVGVATVVGVGTELLALLVLAVLWRGKYKARPNEPQLIEAVLNSLVDGVVVADSAGRFLLANEAAMQVAGVGARGLPPSQWSEAYGLFLADGQTHFPADQLPLVRAIGGEEVRDVDVFVRNSKVPDGAWLNVTGMPLKDASGTARGGVIVFRDVTRRKQAEEVVDHLASAVKQTADAVFITDRGGTIEYVNPAFEVITGYTQEEALGSNPRILRSGAQDAEYYRKLWTTILGGKTFRGTALNRHKDGRMFYAEQTITPMFDGEGTITHFVSVLKDMTERRRIHEQEIEMKVASMVQRQLFPASAPHLDGYDIFGRVLPADATCGDYYDFISLPDGSVGIVVADVSGHGVGPALVMASTRAYLRSLARTNADPGVILGELNEVLVGDLETHYFVTLVMISLDVGTGRLRWANAGHPSGVVVNADGEVLAQLDSTNVPLGMFRDRVYESRETTLSPGDVAVLVTDGIIESECHDGRQFGLVQVVETVALHRRKSAGDIVESLLQARSEFAGEQKIEDDITAVVCKRLPRD